MVDVIAELRKDFNRTLKKIGEFETKESKTGLDIRETREFREWLSLSSNIAERVFLLEHKDRYFGYNEDKVAELKKGLFDGDWVGKKKQSATEKNFIEKKGSAESE